MSTTKKTEPKAAKPKKPPKPAALLKKPIPERRFSRGYLQLLAQEADRKFFDSCFTLDKGAYRLREGLDRATLVRLNKLAKAIKANKGFIKTGPLIVAAILLGAVVVFGLVFMNPLLEKAAELALQGIFEARAELTGFRFNPLKPSVSFARLSIADRDAPMTNLIDLGETELRLNWGALLRLKIDIPTARADSIRFGTARELSGTLSDKPPRVKEKKAASSGAPFVDFGNFDAKALLEREKDKLKSTAAYASAGQAYTEAAERWKTRIETSKTNIAQIKTSSQRLLALDVKAIKSAPEVASALSDARTVLSDGERVLGDAKAIASGVTADWNQANALERAARQSVTTDLAYLRSLVDPKSGAAMAALDPLIRQVLSDKAERFMDYGLKALAVLRRLRASGGDKAEKAAKEKIDPRRGRIVYFPGRQYPLFHLGELSSSFTESGREWHIRLAEVSSEPDLSGQPTSLELAVRVPNGWSVEALATADLRAEARGAFTVKGTAQGLPAQLGSALSSAGIAEFSAIASGGLSLAGGDDGLALTSDILLAKPQPKGASGTFGQALSSAIESAREVRVGVDWKRQTGQEERFAVRSNLDQLVARSLEGMAAKYSASARASLDAAFREYVSGDLESLLGSRGELSGLLGSATGNVSGAESTNTAVKGKMGELEAKAASLLGGGFQLPRLTP